MRISDWSSDVCSSDLTLCGILDALRPRNDGAGYASQIRFVTDRPGHDARYAIDPAKCERELGWRRTYDVATGMRATVQWYLDNGTWCRRATETYEIGRAQCR